MQPGRKAAFGRIVERGCAGPGGGERGLDHQDPGRIESGSSRRQHTRRNPGKTLCRKNLGEHRRALDRRRSNLDDRMSRAKPSGRHDPLRGDSEHLPDHERLAHGARDLGVASDERRPYLIERAPHPFEQRLRVLGGRPFGQQHACEKPSRACSGHRDVVRIDGHGVRPDSGPGEGDGVGRRDERSRLDFDCARVFADAGSEHDLGRKGRRDEAREEVGRELAGREWGGRLHGRSECFLVRNARRVPIRFRRSIVHRIMVPRECRHSGAAIRAAATSG